MTFFRWVRRSLWHYRRTHVGVAAGAAVCASVLSGALLVGHSVRSSLRESALRRLGPFDVAVSLGARRVDTGLIERLGEVLEGGAASALELAAVAIAEVEGGDSLQVNDARLVGIDNALCAAMGRRGAPTVGG